MLCLCIRTDKQDSELFIYKDSKLLAEHKWQAHRKLADTIDSKIANLLEKTNIAIKDIDKIVIFEGPGSFTGLRIGFSVANALGYSYGIPVIASSGKNWAKEGIKIVQNKFRPARPIYGSEPNITKPKK